MDRERVLAEHQRLRGDVDRFRATVQTLTRIVDGEKVEMVRLPAELVQAGAASPRT